MGGDESEKLLFGLSERFVPHRKRDQSLIAGRRSWKTLSFPSTLHLQPVLEILLRKVPASQQPELRLGLQEALVNAAKHGNGLNPQKSVFVRYHRSHYDSCWVIEDQGSGFLPPEAGCNDFLDILPCSSQTCGRGLFILHQIFDEVHWNSEGTVLTLCKRHEPSQLLVLAGCSR